MGRAYDAGGLHGAWSMDFERANPELSINPIVEEEGIGDSQERVNIFGEKRVLIAIARSDRSACAAQVVRISVNAKKMMAADRPQAEVRISAIIKAKTTVYVDGWCTGI